jgi:hypothetical protein
MADGWKLAPGERITRPAFFMVILAGSLSAAGTAMCISRRLAENRHPPNRSGLRRLRMTKARFKGSRAGDLFRIFICFAFFILTSVKLQVTACR